MKLLKVIIVTALILVICGVGGIKASDYYWEAKYGWLLNANQQQASYTEALQNYQAGLVEYYSQLPPKIKTVTETVYVEKPVYRIVERVIIEEKEVEVEVVVYHNTRKRSWDSVEQFEQWYEDLDFRVLLPSSVYTVDCDDYSERLQRLALQQGFPVSEAMAKNHLYAGVWVTKIGGLHAGNLVLIGNDYYWVEPQPDMFNIKQLFERD